MQRARGSSLTRIVFASAAALISAHSACAGHGEGVAAGGGGGAAGTTATTGSVVITTGTGGGGAGGGDAGVVGGAGTGGAHQSGSVIKFPDPTRPWVGAVVIDFHGSLPVAAWRVDGAALATPSPEFPTLLLDTRLLADGPHTLSIDIVEGGSIVTSDTPIHVDNAPSIKPAFTGKLVDISAAAGFPILGAGGMNMTGAVAGDLDGDGKIDLFVWAGLAQAYLQTGPLVFTPLGSGIGGVQAAGMADLDGDGLPNVVAVGTAIHILHNTGGGVLVDVTAGSGLDMLPPRDFRGVTFADVDGDGLIDIAVGQFNCGGISGAPNLILRNEGDMRFADITAEMGLALETGATFTLAIDVTDGDDDLHVWPFEEGCTPVNTQQYRFAPGPDLPVLVNAVKPADDNNPMGSSLLDVDGDGVLDMWISGDTESPVWTGPALSHSEAPYVGLDTYPDAMGHSVQPWSQVLFDADLDGNPDVLAVHLSANVPGTSNAPAGIGLFWHRAPGRFRDVAAQAGLDQVLSCNAAHGADLDLDGDTDLLIGCNNQLLVLRNDLVDPTPGRTIFLHGTISNADGIHAIITTPSGEKRVSRGGGQAYAGGLVRETVRAPSGMLTVAWPSGIVQQVDVGTAPVLNVTEPAVYTVAPRRVGMAAPAPVAVTVDPSALGDPSAPVQVTASAGQWTAPLAVGADGIWRGTLAPPSGAAATVVITVQVGTTVLKTRPRVFVR